MDIGLRKPNPTERTIPIPIIRRIFNAAFTEEMRTSLQHDLSLTIARTVAHQLALVLLELHLQQLGLG